MTSAILAGGRSRRFDGRDKSALVVGGHTILARQLAILAPVADDILMVYGASAARSRRDQPLPPHVRLVYDHVEDCGPLGGLEAALDASRADHLILLACDMPFVTGAFLSHLITLAADADVVVPRTSRGYHPLCAVYARRCLPTVTQHLSAGRLAMVELLKALRVREVMGAELQAFDREGRLLANVNTAAEYAALEREHCSA